MAGNPDLRCVPGRGFWGPGWPPTPDSFQFIVHMACTFGAAGTMGSKETSLILFMEEDGTQVGYASTWEASLLLQLLAGGVDLQLPGPEDPALAEWC